MCRDMAMLRSGHGHHSVVTCPVVCLHIFSWYIFVLSDMTIFQLWHGHVLVVTYPCPVVITDRKHWPVRYVPWHGHVAVGTLPSIGRDMSCSVFAHFQLIHFCSPWHDNIPVVTWPCSSRDIPMSSSDYRSEALTCSLCAVTLPCCGRDMAFYRSWHIL